MQVSEKPTPGLDRPVRWSVTLPALLFCLLLIESSVPSLAADDQAEETDHWAFQPLVLDFVVTAT